MKNNIFDYASNLIIAGGGFYLFGKKIGIQTVLVILTSRFLGKHIVVLFQKNNATGTTPYNPLKIPAKKMTPANII